MATARRTRPAPSVQTEERGAGYVNTSMIRRKEVIDETDQELEILRERFTTEAPAAFLRVAGGQTINLGDFNSLRIDVGVTIPCSPDRLEEAYEIASDFVAEKMAEEQTRWLGPAEQKQTKRGK